jgi:ATPase family associated with various cellular activities (AAA)
MTDEINEIESLKQESFEHLLSEINYLRWRIDKLIAQSAETYESSEPPDDISAPPDVYCPEDSRLDQLCDTFNLSDLERNILILCAGVEIDEQLAADCAVLTKQTEFEFVTLGLVQRLYGELRKQLLNTGKPLLKWQLIDISSGRLLKKSLKIDDWVLQFLLGNDEPTPLAHSGILEPEWFCDGLKSVPPSYDEPAQGLHRRWRNIQSPKQTLQLCGSDPIAHQHIAALTCDQFDWSLFTIDLDTLSTLDVNGLRNWLVWWYRRAMLHDHVLLVEYDNPAQFSPNEKKALATIRKTLKTPLVLSGSERLSGVRIPTFDIKPISAEEQKQTWLSLLKDKIGLFNPLETQIGAVVSQFNLSAATIQNICDRLIDYLKAEGCPDPGTFNALLLDCCRTETRTNLEGLVERIEPTTTWDDLVLNPDATEVLYQLIATARNRNSVFSKWRMGGNTKRGMGITSMFFGPPGTGKTTAAELIARELGLDLYRVDLSQVSDKYIGETEKKLKQIFDEAEKSGALLLFDEADALIGKRTDVKDSKDRYANQSVSYLLQRMETYIGIAILTTNLPNAIDSAFMRRIRFSVRFEYPSLEQRFEIWKQQFPKEAPTEGLSFQRLAQLNVSGAIIRNIALGAAFLAMEDGVRAGTELPIRMSHLLSAARAECLKQSRPITDEEIRGWV